MEAYISIVSLRCSTSCDFDSVAHVSEAYKYSGTRLPICEWSQYKAQKLLSTSKQAVPGL